MEKKSNFLKKGNPERGLVNISMTAVPVRTSHGKRGYSFVLLMDHTGFISLCGKESVIRTMESSIEDSSDDIQNTVIVTVTSAFFNYFSCFLASYLLHFISILCTGAYSWGYSVSELNSEQR